MRWLILIPLLTCALPALARMYQWTDPKTGITQLAGMPPPWYRSERGGPRVLVFENGRIIDDTSIKVPDAKRMQLREQALVQASGNKDQATKQLQSTAQLGAEFGSSETSPEQPSQKQLPERKPAAAKPPERPTAPPAPTAGANKPAAPTAEQMRQLIQRWEAAQEENARRQANIESAPPASGP